MHKLFALLQIADSSWPTGSFVFSSGLEALAKRGHIQDMASFTSYLKSFLIQISEADLLFINSVFELNEQNFERDLDEIVTDWQAWNQVETMLRANILLGENWFNLFDSVYSPEGMEPIRAFFKTKKRPFYFTIVFPLLLKRAGFDLLSVQQLFYHMAVRDQINAAIRLGLFGPETAQKTHFEFLRFCEVLREIYKDCGYHEATRSQPVLELGQGSHQYLYSRIFQS